MRDLIFSVAIFFSAISAQGAQFKPAVIPQKPIPIEMWRYNEWNIDALIANFVNKKATIVQAGVGDPQEVLPIANRWKHGKVYIFEPNPQHYKKLKNYRFYFGNVTVYEAALNSYVGHTPFYLGGNEANSRIGSLLPAEDDWKWYYQDHHTITVQSIHLEEWAAKKQVDVIDVLYLNTGGTELSILKSIPNLLKSMIAVVVQTHQQPFRKKIGLYQDVLEYMTEQGFVLIKHWGVPDYQGLAVFVKQGFAEVRSR